MKAYQEPYHSSYAIIAAIDDYDRVNDKHHRGKTGYTSLTHMVDRAEELRGVLLKLGFPGNHIFTFYDDRATTGNLTDAVAMGCRAGLPCKPGRIKRPFSETDDPQLPGFKAHLRDRARAHVRKTTGAPMTLPRSTERLIWPMFSSEFERGMEEVHEQPRGAIQARDRLRSRDPLKAAAVPKKLADDCAVLLFDPGLIVLASVSTTRVLSRTTRGAASVHPLAISVRGDELV